VTWQPPLLPNSPSARLGKVIHSLFEAAGKGDLGEGNPLLITQAWAEALTDVEGVMAESWVESPLLPLSKSVPDFEVRRLRAFERAAGLSRGVGRRKPSRSGNLGTGSEIWVESDDGLVGGFVDAAIQLAGGVVIRDYKSGVFTEVKSPRTAKLAHQTQLRLYAALYQSSFGRWPTGLELVPLNGDAIQVEFSPDECASLLREATEALKRVNGRIQDLILSPHPHLAAGSLATPAPSTCRYCGYRPACFAYHAARGESTAANWPADLAGEISEVRVLANGRLSVSATDLALGSVLRARGINPDPHRHPGLLFAFPGRQIQICNLRRTASPKVLSESASTVIYVAQSQGIR